MLATMTARPQRSKTQYRPEARDDRHASQGQLVGARSGAAGGTGVAGVIAGAAIEDVNADIAGQEVATVTNQEDVVSAAPVRMSLALPPQITSLPEVPTRNCALPKWRCQCRRLGPPRKYPSTATGHQAMTGGLHLAWVRKSGFIA